MLKKMLITVFTVIFVWSLSGCSIPFTKNAPIKQNDDKTTVDNKTNQNNEEKNQKSDNKQQEESDSATDQKGNKKEVNPVPFKQDGQTVTVVANPTDQLVLVNKTHQLPEGYKPKNLIVPDVPFPYSNPGQQEKAHMRADAGHALEAMFKAAKKEGNILYAQSGFRSYTRQKAIFAYNVKTKGEKEATRVSAHPGQSEHETGLAMDITSEDVGYDLVQKFGETPEGGWVAKHAHEYGFIVRYPEGKEGITGYEYEPWHLRYVGTEVASFIYNNQITLEEYSEK